MSRLPFELMIALRYLRPKRTFVSIITLICVIGVMLGVAVLIVVLSVMTGFDHDLKDKIFGFKAHLTVSSRGNRLKDWREAQAVISKMEHVRGVAPFVMSQAFVMTDPPSGESQFAAQMIRGIDPKVEGSISVLPKSVVEGEFNLRGNRILLGSAFAREIGLQPGDHVSIYSPRDLQKMNPREKNADDEKVVAGDYQVAGIFDVGYFEFNSTFVITSLTTAQDLYDLGEDVNGLKVMLDDPGLAEVVRAQIGMKLPGAYITTWFEESSAFLDALMVEKNVMFYLLFFIMIVAAFGITSAQITFVVQKTREIGMLKALGATGRQITAIFLLQSCIVGIIGVICGYGLGMLAVAYRNEFLAFLRRTLNMEVFPQSIYMFKELPAIIDPRDVIVICTGSLVICVLAGLLPAWNAGRLKPVEALRHE
ncbi:MAG TPA: ABC transporter permease [Verrucomicrobiae bacterium]|nr:ABC transporter permease [Verrucomicrobiae bacterium]